MTPPPQEPPRPDSLPSYGTIQPAIREQLDLLADGQGNITAALGRLWDTRNDPARLQRLEDKLDGYAKATTAHDAQLGEFVMPAVKSLMGRLDLLLSGQERRYAQQDHFHEREWPRHQKQLEGLAKSLADLVDRLGRLETTKEKLADNVSTLALRVNAAETKDATLEQRVAALELRNRDHDAGDKREVAITKRQQRLFMGAVAAGSAALSFLVSNLGTIANWFRK